jgi:restriction endonuclease S subunit
MTNLPDGWNTKTLKDWGMDAQSGFASGAHNSENKGIIHLRPMNISRLGKLDFESYKSVEDESSRRIVKGDILFNNTNSAELVGKTTLIDIDGEFAYSNHMTRLRFPIEEVAHKYMSILLHSLWMSGYFNEICSNHVNQASVSIKRLEQVEVSLPPLPEQHKIVEILEDHLSRLDAALADVKQAKVKAAQFRRSLLQAAFTGNLGSHGTRVMSSEMYIPFGKTFDILSNDGKSLKQKDYLSEGAFRVIDQGENLVGGFTNREDLVLNFGTPIIVFGDHTRKIKLVDGSFVPGADGTKLLKPKSGIDFKFAFHQLNSKELRNRGYARHFSELKKETFWIPPLPEQHKIVEILEDHLSRLDTSVALTDAMEKQSAGLRRSLLQAAFTGQLTKEVASV